MNESICAVKEFDRTKSNLLLKIVKYFFKKEPDIKSEIFNEMTGFSTEVSLEELKNKIREYDSQQYTGLDEVTLKSNKKILLSAIMHEDLCLLFIDKKTKEELEDCLKITLVKFKK